MSSSDAAMTAWDVANYLRVSRQRVEAISRNAAYHFPVPLEGRKPRVWARADVEAWAEARWWRTLPWRRRSPSS